MSSIFERLGFNFDTNKFGDGQYLTPQAKAYLNAAPIDLAQWQQDDIANSDVALTKYYKNPLANDCTLLIANTSAIINFIETHEFDSDSGSANSILLITAQNLANELGEFVSHTNNVSGISTMTSNTDTIPSLDSATSIGNFLLRVVSVSDKIQNTTPLLGSMTCLFIGEEVNSNVYTVNTNLTTLNNSDNGSGVSNVTQAQVLTINTNLENLNNYMYYRRTSDWNFFTNATSIVLDTVTVSVFNNLGNTQLYLINNLIGTETLKNNLANTSNNVII